MVNGQSVFIDLKIEQLGFWALQKEEYILIFDCASNKLVLVFLKSSRSRWLLSNCLLMSQNHTKSRSSSGFCHMCIRSGGEPLIALQLTVALSHKMVVLSQEMATLSLDYLETLTNYTSHTRVIFGHIH